MRVAVVVCVSACSAEIGGGCFALAVRMGVVMIGGLHVMLVLHEMLIDGDGDHHGEHEENRDDERSARAAAAFRRLLPLWNMFHADDLLSRRRRCARSGYRQHTIIWGKVKWGNSFYISFVQSPAERLIFLAVCASASRSVEMRSRTR